MPTRDKPHVIQSLEDAVRLSRARRKRKAGKKKKPLRLFLTPTVEVPPDLLAARQKLIDEVLGGFAKWEAAHNEGKKRGAGLGLENVVGVYIGQKKADGAPRPELCIVVEVLKKADKDKLACKIPPKIKVGNRWVLTDIQIGKMVTPQAFAGELCSLYKPGAGSGKIEGGTIGYACSVAAEDSYYGCIISNSHVLGEFLNSDVQENDEVYDNFAPTGNLIGLYYMSGEGGLDAALAWIKGAGVAMHARRGFDVMGLLPEDAHMPYSGQHVKAFGARSQTVRYGVVAHIDVSKTVNYPNAGVKTVQHCFTINTLDSTPFSLSGDSGSAVVDADTGEPLGLLIGSDGAEGALSSVAHHIGFVLDGLGIAKILDATST